MTSSAMPYLKSAGTTAGKVVLVAVGIPYGVAIFINSLIGWPQSDPNQSRVGKQLHPSRVIKLNYAMYQQITMAKWLPLVLRVRSFYRNADANLQNIPFGDNGMKMDVWLPRSKHYKNEKPVIFFIYGGAWGSGYKELYAKLGQEVANTLDSIVVIPDYRIYPKGIMQDMIQDIIDSIHEFRKIYNTFKHSANINNIILMGHSAGGHLSTMTAIEIAARNPCAMVNTGPCSDEDCHNLHKYGSLRDDDDTQQRHKLYEDDRCQTMQELGSDQRVTMDIREASSIEGTDEAEDRLVDLVPSLVGVIAIGGVYNIMDHYHHETKRGVEDISAMWRAAEGLQKFDKYSPALLVPDLTADQKKRLPPHLLIHGLKDTTVPDSSSSIYGNALSNAGVDTLLKLLPEAGHAELVMDMMESGRKWYDVMMNTIMEGTNGLLRKPNY